MLCNTYWNVVLFLAGNRVSYSFEETGFYHFSVWIQLCQWASVIQDFKVVFLVHWPSWIGGQATQLHSSYQAINESLRHTGGVSKHSHWLLTTANLLLLQEITSARCRMFMCASLFMEYERDWLDRAVTPNCHPITHPLDLICYIEHCSTMHQFMHYPKCSLLNTCKSAYNVLMCRDIWQHSWDSDEAKPTIFYLLLFVLLEHVYIL